MTTSLLPNQILPETIPIGAANSDGTVTINHQWWLFLYNLFLTVAPSGTLGAMATNTIPLSGSSAGLPIPVNAGGTPGILVHTAPTGTGAYDQIYLWASNVTGSAATLTVLWGSILDPGAALVEAVSIPANSAPIAIAVGQGLGSGAQVTAYSNTPNAINLTGYAIRTPPTTTSGST